jgi:hypothetical protein
MQAYSHWPGRRPGWSQPPQIQFTPAQGPINGPPTVSPALFTANRSSSQTTVSGMPQLVRLTTPTHAVPQQTLKRPWGTSYAPVSDASPVVQQLRDKLRMCGQHALANVPSVPTARQANMLPAAPVSVETNQTADAVIFAPATQHAGIFKVQVKQVECDWRPRQREDGVHSAIFDTKVPAKVSLASTRMQHYFRQAAIEAAGTMVNDDSELALRPLDNSSLADAVESFQDLMGDAYAESTSNQDWGSHWTWWKKWCSEFNTPPIRNKDASTLTHKERKREIFLMAAAVPWILHRMKPGPGRQWPQPESAAKVIRAVVRNHYTLGYTMPELKAVNLAVKALQNRYVTVHGPESLEPHRKEPIPFELVEGLVRLFGCVGTVLAGVVISKEILWVSLIAMVALHYQSGLRKGETTSQTKHLNKRDMSRASISWLINGVNVTNPNRQQLLGMVNKRDYAVAKPPPSKCDTRGMVWGTKLMYFLYDENQLAGAAKALRQLELEFPVMGEARRTTPLFSSAEGTAMNGTVADKMLTAALRILAPKSFGQYSWHSFRRALACSMLAAKCSNAEIQAVCRWQSEESLWIYAQLEPTDYANILAAAYGKNFQRSMAHNLPDLDEAGLIAMLDQVQI